MAPKTGQSQQAQPKQGGSQQSGSQQSEDQQNVVTRHVRQFRAHDDPVWYDKSTNVQHSGFTPMFPTFPYNTYDLTTLTKGPKPTYVGLDRLFYGEGTQNQEFRGLKTWQSGILSRDLYQGIYDPQDENDDPITTYDKLKTRFVKVDEENWPKFWRKNRWFGPLDNPLDIIEDPTQDIIDSEPKQWSVDNPAIWAHLRISIEIAVRILRVLVASQPKLVHELMHALWRLRTTEAGVPLFEPFFPPDWYAELGFIAEKRIYGGSLHGGVGMPGRPYRSKELLPRRIGPYRLTYHHHLVEKWPRPSDVFAPEFLVENAQGRILVPEFTTNEHIPIWWTSAMVCEEYWKDTVGKYGMDAFRPRGVLQVTYRLARTGPEFFPAQLLSGPLTGVQSEMKPSRDDFAVRWNHRNQRWATMRPWYAEEYRIWNATPWGMIGKRFEISKFREAHTARDLVACKTIADNMDECLAELVQNEIGRTPERNSVAAVGLLMCAAMPYFTTTRTKVLEPSTQRVFNPSSTMANKFLFTLEYEEEKQSVEPGWCRDPASALRVFEETFRDYSSKWPCPTPWIFMCVKTFRDLVAQRATLPDGAWPTTAPYVPDYNPSTWLIRSDRAFAIYEPALWDPAPMPGSEPPAPVPAPVTAASSSMKRALSLTGSQLPQRYFSVGEIADHRTVNDAWVVEENNNHGFDVYNITDILRRRGCTSDQFRELITFTQSGCRTLVRDNELAQEIRGEFGKTIGSLGTQWVERYPEEVSECNGINGSPTWVTFGTAIYDITSFPFASGKERELLIQRSNGQVALFPEDSYSSDLPDRLRPYRCGTLITPPEKRNNRLTPLTMNMLRWRDNPAMGVYVAINGQVWDVLSYVDKYPDGKTTLMRSGGVDRTEFFRDNPPDFLQGGHDDRLVGRIVPEMKLEDITANQVVLHGWVFNIGALAFNEPESYAELRQYGGTDASSVLTGERAQGEVSGYYLSQLYLDGQEYIVGNITDETAAKRQITTGDLAQHSDPGGIYGTWLSIGQDVYNVTEIMRFPDFYPLDIPIGFAGRELTDPRRAAWLQTEHAARRIGKLVPGPATEPVDRGPTSVAELLKAGEHGGTLGAWRNVVRHFQKEKEDLQSGPDWYYHLGGQQPVKRRKGDNGRTYLLIDGEKVELPEPHTRK
ncbi:hypothetical protein AAE478_005375 [Parahypoxylon ruwenzoriense]